MTENRESRALWIVVALVVGFILGWLLRLPIGGGGTSPVPTPTAVPSLPTATVVPMIPTPLPTCVPLGVPGEQKVKIGPDIKAASPYCITLNALQDTVRWTTDVTGVELWIEFPDRPFKNMAKGEHETNRVQCTGDTCTSDKVVTTHPSDANYDETTKRWWKAYKYTQVFHKPGGPTSEDQVEDGRIIIRW